MQYQAPMLPRVDYKKLTDEEEYSTGLSLTDLEHDTMESCRHFLEAVKLVLLKSRQVQIHELQVAHLCAYLGAVMSLHTVHDAEKLAPRVVELIRHQADASFKHFSQFPINGTVRVHQKKKQNLEKLRENTPGSIIVQTMRLGRTILDILQELSNNRPLTNQKQKELFCDQESLIKIMFMLGGERCSQWRKILGGLPDNYVINQLAIQTGWLIGYFSHMDNNPPEKTAYLVYGLPMLELYREQIYNMMSDFARHHHQQENQRKHQEMDTLIDEIHQASEKTHSQQSIATTDFQKQIFISKSGIEKVIIELMEQSCAVKTILMSLFYFWFTLEVPLQAENPEDTENMDPMLHMGNLIELVKETVKNLPQPEFSPEIMALNSKMQEARKYMPNPESLDTVPREQVVKHVEKVNTAIHSIISSYLKQDFHPQTVANALFIHWLRMSVFFGVSERGWQKMDFYNREIMDAARQYLADVTR